MIKIAVIDDDKNVLGLIVDKIKETIGERTDIYIFPYDSAETFFGDIKNKESFHIVFSNIGLKEMSGLELGEKLKANCSQVHLVYLTSSAEFAMESYLLNAYQYILKKDMDVRLPEVLQSLLVIVEKDLQTFIIVGATGNQQKVNVNALVCIEKVKGTKYVEYVTADAVLRDRKTMEQVMHDVENQGFILVERGHAVNMQHVVSIKDNVVTMSNGREFLIGRTRLADVREQLNRFWGVE